MTTHDLVRRSCFESLLTASQMDRVFGSDSRPHDQLFVLRARRTASGRIGKWRRRAPTAANTAFPTAGPTTMVAGSPRVSRHLGAGAGIRRTSPARRPYAGGV